MNNTNKFIEKHKNKELEDGLNYGFTISIDLLGCHRMHIHAKTFDSNEDGIILYDTEHHSIMTGLTTNNVISVFCCSNDNDKWGIENILYDSSHEVK